MKTKADGQAHAELESLRGRIEYWRRTRTKRTRMPEDLWREAVSLAGRHGISRVSRVAGVGFEGLKRRVSVAGAAVIPAVPSPAREAGFVEVSPRDLLEIPWAERVGRTTIEVTAASGAKLTMQLGGRESFDPAAITAAFLGRMK